MGVWSDVYSTNRAIEVQQADGSATLLAHLVHHVMPQRFPALQQQQQGPVQAAGSSIPHGAAQQQQALQTEVPLAGAAAADSGDLTHQQDAMQQAQAEAASDPLGVLTSTHSEPAAAGAADGDEPGSSRGARAEAADVAAAAASGNSRPDSQPSQPLADLSASSAAAAPADSVQAAGDVVLPASWPAACAVYVCGVEPDWRTPLGWLHANFKAADGFLYVVVHLFL
jgi:hypothetical protein